MRTVPTRLIGPALSRFDKIVSLYLENQIVSQPLTKLAMSQTSLGVSVGGLGLRSATEQLSVPVSPTVTNCASRF